jgi:ribonuclease J
LVRIAKGEHPHIKIRPGDRVLLSAAPIPGNELAVVNMINELIRKGADVVTNQELDLHVSGHGRQDDLKLMLSLVKPEYFVPVHGELYMRYAHKKLAMELGMPDENVFLIDNGSILEVYSDKVKVSDKKLKLDTIMIDGLGIGHLSGEYVIKARQIMAEDGMIALIFKVDSKTKELV